MRFIRLLVLSLVLLFVVITAISLFIPFRVRISRAINVKAKPDAVWVQVDDMNKWMGWNPFFASVETDKITKLDTSFGKLNAMRLRGTLIHWKEITPNEHVAAMEREGRKPVLNGWKCIAHPGSDSTTVQWYMDFNLRWYPWEKFGSIMFERSYGPQMEKGLARLKEITEAGHSSNN